MNNIDRDSQKLAAISALYTDLYNTDLDVEDFSDAFYFTVGAILEGYIDYNIDSILKLK